ncbi:MAG: hypothetical protein J0G29_06275 [Alphaproteobacteria bacterium]|nr:hypothetical protein [Alphaproteobacteria bacterium]OJV46354.1 MAG: hypothetical protein BGO28_03255 [Alphaproteobacteria bacterium 43-37]
MNDVSEDDKKNLLRLQKIQQESRLELVKSDMQSPPAFEDLLDLDVLKSTYLCRRPKITYH